MEWTKPLSFALVVLTAALVVGSVVEIARTTFAVGDHVIASLVTTALVGLVVLVTVAVGVRNRRWIRNPDHYW